MSLFGVVCLRVELTVPIVTYFLLIFHICVFTGENKQTKSYKPVSFSQQQQQSSPSSSSQFHSQLSPMTVTVNTKKGNSSWTIFMSLIDFLS